MKRKRDDVKGLGKGEKVEEEGVFQQNKKTQRFIAHSSPEGKRMKGGEGG